MNDFKKNSKHWMTTNRLYKLILIGAVLGVIMPLVTVVLKLSLNNFREWHKLKSQFPAVERLAAKYPLLDISKTLPFLPTLSWHNPEGKANYSYYINHAAFNASFIILIFVYRRKAKEWMTKLIDFLYGEEQRFARVLIFSSTVFFIFTYQTQLSFGFWFAGISGWTYAERIPKLKPTPPKGLANNLTSKQLSFLSKAIMSKNAAYLPDEGYLPGKAMFLHFQNGEVLPANYELTGFVFPQYIFGSLYKEVKYPKAFYDAVKAQLAKRQAGHRFLLPLSVAYPNHAAYMTIDYIDYPKAETLEEISFWELTIFVDKEHQVEIVKATRKVSINAKIILYSSN